MPTYPLDFPSNPGLESASLRLVRATQILSSPFTASEQRGELSFAVWSLKATTPTIDGDSSDSLDWRAFFIELRGRAGTFKMPVPGVTGSSTGYSGASGLVNGASQTGTSIVTDGWDVSTSLLARGDYFMIGEELKMCMSDISSNGTGAATIDFEPAIQTSPADNAAITLSNPYCIMRMTKDDYGWDLTVPVLHSFSFEAVEVIQ